MLRVAACETLAAVYPMSRYCFASGFARPSRMASKLERGPEWV